MKIPKQAQRQANALFKACRADGVPDFGRVGQLVDLVVEKRPRGWRMILEHIRNRTRLELARRTVKVQSTVELDEPQREEVIRTVRGQHPGEPLEFEFGVDPGLLGGLKIQVGWTVLDASLRARLESILRAEN